MTDDRTEAGQRDLPFLENAPDAIEPEEATADRPGLETYPIDSLLIRTETRAIQDVLRRIEKGFLILDPDFQREFVWKADRQSRLIESVVMRIPLPVFYVAEKEDGRLVVVDGRQRLTTFQRFSTEDLALRLPGSPMDGLTFSGLAPKLQNRFEDGQITFYIIDPKVPERVRLDIFDRVNSGEPLTRQQMRNALHNGPATALLRELCNSDKFLMATGGALNTDAHRKFMDDREAVNRWLAFELSGWQSYDGRRGYDEFLGDALTQCNRMGDAERARLSNNFTRSMGVNERIFGGHAFRKHNAPSEARRPLNLALFDVFSVLLSPYDEAEVVGKESKVRSGFYRLMQHDRYFSAISRGTLHPSNVNVRFTMTSEMIRSALGAP